jgi:hypothetical protein
MLLTLNLSIEDKSKQAVLIPDLFDAGLKTAFFYRVGYYDIYDIARRFTPQEHAAS